MFKFVAAWPLKVITGLELQVHWKQIMIQQIFAFRQTSESKVL